MAHYVVLDSNNIVVDGFINWDKFSILSATKGVISKEKPFKNFTIFLYSHDSKWDLLLFFMKFPNTNKNIWNNLFYINDSSKNNQ